MDAGDSIQSLQMLSLCFTTEWHHQLLSRFFTSTANLMSWLKSMYIGGRKIRIHWTELLWNTRLCFVPMILFCLMSCHLCFKDRNDKGKNKLIHKANSCCYWFLAPMALLVLAYWFWYQFLLFCFLFSLMIIRCLMMLRLWLRHLNNIVNNSVDL